MLCRLPADDNIIMFNKTAATTTTFRGAVVRGLYNTGCIPAFGYSGNLGVHSVQHFVVGILYAIHMLHTLNNIIILNIVRRVLYTL